MNIDCHPKAAVSVVIVRNDKILLVKRGQEPSLGLWSLPGGKIELGETAREAAAREVMEETGLVVEIDGVAGIQDVIGQNNTEIAYHYVIIGFFASVISGNMIAATDAADARWFPLKELHEIPTTPGLTQWIDDLDFTSGGQDDKI